MHGRNLRQSERRAIVDAYQRGEKVVAIACEFNIDESWPCRLARKFGVPVRAPGRPKRGRNEDHYGVLANSCVSMSHRLSPVIG